MWKIYSLLGFDNFFTTRADKMIHRLKVKNPKEIFHHNVGSPYLRIKETTAAKSKCYSEDNLSNSNSKDQSPFEYPSPQRESSNEPPYMKDDSNFESITNYREKADEIINELLLKTESTLDDFELIHEDKTKPEGLKIYLKSYLNEEKHRINIYRSQWKIPCNPEIFLEFMNDTSFQITLDPNILEFFSFENAESDIFLMYLLYKKMYVVDSRDFVYLKHYKLIDEKHNIWAYSTKSITHEKYPELKRKVRGEILLSGNIIKQTAEQESMVTLYSEINLKINLPVVLMKSKTVSEMKKYVESFLNYMKRKNITE